MTRLLFGTKADTLASVASHLKSARVLPQAVSTVEAWRQSRCEFLDAVAALPWAGGRLIVRSSARAEDSATQSLAGRFLSLGGVEGRASLEQAIEDVFGSYGAETKPDDQVLVQPMLDQVELSGVV